MATDPVVLRVLISPVIEQATVLAARVEAELPTHQGLKHATQLIVAAARTAQRLAAAMKRPLGPHRLPVMFLAAAVVGVLTFLYWQFFHVAELTLALPDRDAASVRASVEHHPRLKMHVVEVPGSREAAQLLDRGEVDVGFIQGGLDIPKRLLRLETRSPELVLYFVRERIHATADVKTVMTSVEGEGSHAVAKAFFSAWGQPVNFVHTWKHIVADATAIIPEEVDAVFVVKDPGDDKTLTGVARLTANGFHLASPALGAKASRFDALRPTVIAPGYLQSEPPVPASSVDTYSVTTFLVARDGLTPRLLTQAAEVIEDRPGNIADRSFRLNSVEASELFQGVDAFFSVLVNIGLAFLGLLGLDVVAYRKRFHELNSLVSLISMLQSNKDVLGVEGATRSENLLYLSLCSDLLGLISTISGYYTQESPSVLFNNLSHLVHQRCDALKLNIQLKLLHSLVPKASL
jgi:hypothetical protein